MARGVALLWGVCVMAALAGGLARPAHAEELAPAVPPALTNLAQAPVAESAPEGGVLERTQAVAREVAETTRQAAQTFQQSLAGQSLLVGITQPAVNLNLQSRNQSKFTSTVESYKGTDDLNYMVAVTSDAKQSDALQLTDSLSAVASANFAWNYGTFSLKQSLQESAAGGTAGGTANGDYMYFGLQMNGRLIWANRLAPAALGMFYVAGKGFARYRARLDYTVAGQGYRVDVQNDGVDPRQMLFGGFDLRLGQFFYRIESMQIFGDSYATHRGRRVFVYFHELDMRVQTLGYAIRF